MVYLKITEVAHIFALLFPAVTAVTVGLHFGQFFHKRIWQPCLEATMILVA
jgi:hypothetical protein